MANVGVVTTGLVPLAIGSVETFQLQPLINRLPWDLQGGSASVILSPPTGGNITINATIAVDGSIRAQWTVIAPEGNWLLAWDCTDALGRHQVSNPIPFDVISSP